VASKWIIGGRSKNYGGRKEEGTSINGNQSSHSIAFDGCRNSRHKIYGRVKVEVDAHTRALTFYKFMECQRSDGAEIVRLWTVINPTENISGGALIEKVRTKKKNFVPNLTKSDQINQVLAEGMTEKDIFLYEGGGGAEAYLKLMEVEAQQNKVSP